MELEQQIQEAYKTSRSYPELAKAFIAMGVKSYTVDVCTGIILYRFDKGVNAFHATSGLARRVSEAFNQDLTIQAVRDNQQGKTNYPGFMDDIAHAGVRFYEATLNGEKKRVTYIGQGGYYEEPIPL